uniref:Adenylate cyclase type 10 n=2 Tax=Lygus hesperus TaxID=30085 RepID=A0A0A9Y9P0_LYGHE
MGCVAMGILYTSIFKSRYYSGKVHESIEAGLIALKLSQVTLAMDAEMWILERLCMALLITRNLETLQECLHPNMYMREEINSSQHVAKMKLYHRLILEAFLEGSIALENPIRIFPIMKKTVSRRHLEIEHPQTRSAGITIWLWYLRKGEFNRAASWQLPEYPDIDVRQERLRDLLRIVQCQLLWLEFKMRTNVFFSQRMESCSQNLRFLFKFMKKKVYDLAPYLLPRYYHMRAYYTLLSYDNFGSKSSTLPGFALLLKAHKYAENQGNFLEQSWISHSRRLWYKPEKIGDPDFWVNHMDDDAIGVEDFDNYNWPDIMFSLKVPERIDEEIKRLRSYVSLPDSISIASSKEGEED